MSAVHTAVGRLPVLAGKPEAAIFEEAVSRFGGTKPLFLGDRLDTDILGANRAGIDSALVLTGVDQAKQLLAADAASRPTFLLDDLRQLSEPYPHASTQEDPRTGVRSITVGDAVVTVTGSVITVAEAGVAQHRPAAGRMRGDLGQRHADLRARGSAAAVRVTGSLKN